MCARHSGPRPVRRRLCAVGLGWAIALGLLGAGCGGGDGPSSTVTVVAPPAPVAPPAVAPPTAALPPAPPATSPATPTTPPATPTTPPATPVVPPAPVAPPAPQAQVPRPADFPNGEEAALLARVRDTADPFCTRSEEGDRAPSARASLICDLSAADGVEVFIESFGSMAALNATYESLRRDQEIPTDTGSCFAGAPPGEGGYTAGAVSGRLLCYTDDRGRVWLVWSEEPNRILLWAFAADGDAVRRFWPMNGLIQA